ncbi:MAG: SDR family NAD(P)-dependent oxidoreductase, partial [Planktomarina temperata]|nr:SDR family NAD(P)-dependent oxidoreductase [Planktomarina temperata]
QGHGRILNCSSILGFITLRFRGAYNSTKFALEGLSDTLRIEMRGTGIKVILIEPGPIGTKIRENSIPHFEKWIDWKNSPRRAQYEHGLIKRLYNPPEGPDAFELPASAVTATVVKALNSANPKPRYYVTTPTYVMGFLRRILPTRALDWLLVRM